MSVLITSMEMPKEGTVFVIDSTGQVWSNEWPTRGYTRLDGVKAVPVPPHGRLIDADALKKNAYPFPCAIGTEWAVTLRQINDAPTIILASEEGET